ncbi:MAG: AAA family ATPase [Micavibrio sp.]|nr:AAA family ATPase [Micavibrio sp.]
MRPNLGLLEDVDFTPAETYGWFYYLKLEELLQHPTPLFVALVVLFIAASGTLLWLLNSRRLLMWRAMRGSLRAMLRLSKRQLRKKIHPDLRLEARQLMRNARERQGWAMYTMGTHLADPDDRCFKQDRKLSFLWLKKAASAKDEQAQELLYAGAQSATRVHDEDTPHNGDPFRELRGMIGLENVKKAVSDITSRTQMFEKRRAEGLRVSQPALHLVFLGNPGTGKTTVARLLGRMLKKVGYLSRGHVVEVSEGELIGEYVGQTPIKVHRKIQQALGGILFIDEAYSMLNAVGDNASFSGSAIATLVKFMEDLRHDLVVIVAGYPKEMIQFLESNPGLKSRFTEVIGFPDYDPPDLSRIYLGLCKDQQYKLERETRDRLLDIMQEARETFTHNFSNGRFVRNLFEDSIRFMAIRVARKKQTTREDLMLIYQEDLENAYLHARRAYGHKEDEPRGIGFFAKND